MGKQTVVKKPKKEKMTLVIKLDSKEGDGRSAIGFKDHREVVLELTRSEATQLLDLLEKAANGS